MFNWLRKKLRSWLGVDSQGAQLDQIDFMLGIKGGGSPYCVLKWIDRLNDAIVDQGKSFQKQMQELSEIDGNNPAVPSIPNCGWQKTKLGGAIAELRNNHEALLHHIGPPYLAEPKGVRTVYMELEHLRNRLAKLEPKPKVARAKKGR